MIISSSDLLSSKQYLDSLVLSNHLSSLITTQDSKLKATSLQV